MMHRIGRLPFRQPARPQRPPELTNTWECTPENCTEVKSLLAKATRFPPELVDMVMDLAEYWACTVASIDYSATATGELRLIGTTGGRGGDQFLLRSKPLGFNAAWLPNNQRQWETEAPAFKLQEEYSQDELQQFMNEPPITLAHPCRKVAFDITSHDQGWGGEFHSKGSFRSSWTWFDAGLDRFDKCASECNECSDNGSDSDADTARTSQRALKTCSIRPVWPPASDKPAENENQPVPVPEYNHQLLPACDHMIQCNRVATKEMQQSHVEWSWTDDITDPESSEAQELEANGRGCKTADGSFVRSLKVGDMVTIWARARFPGWSNNVRKAEIRVYWAV